MIQVEEQQESSLSLINHNLSLDSSMHTSISVPTMVVQVSDSRTIPAISSNDSISSPQRMNVVTTNNRRRNDITKMTNSPVSVLTIESRVTPSSSLSSSIPIPSIPIPPLNVDFCTSGSGAMKPIQLDFSIYCATKAPLSTPPIKGILKSKSNYSPSSLSAMKTTTGVRNCQTSPTSRAYYQGKTERRVKGLWNPINNREDIILENTRSNNKINATKTKMTTYCFNQQQNKNNTTTTTKTNPFDLLHNEFLVKDILGSFATLYEKTKIIPLVCKRFHYLASAKEFSEYYFHTIDNHEHHTINFPHSDHLSQHNKKNDCDSVLLLKNTMKKHNSYIKTISLNANSLTLSPSHPTTSKSDHLLNNLLLTHDNSSIYQHIFPSSSLQNLNLIHFDTLTDTHLQCLFLFHKMQVNRKNENKNKFTTLLSSPSTQEQATKKKINQHFFFSFDDKESKESLLFMKNEETPKLKILPSTTRQRSHTITEESSFSSSLFSRSTSLPPRQNSSLNNNMMSSISTLKTLKLEYCPLLTNQSLYYIKLHCSQLQYLSLKGNTQINIQGLYHLQSLFSIVGGTTTKNNSKSKTQQQQRPASMMTLSNLFESHPGKQQHTKKKHVSIISSNSFFTPPPSKSSRLSSTITSTNNIDTSSKSIVTTGGSLTSMDFSFCPGITLRDMNEVLQDSIDNNMKEPCCEKDTNQNASFLDYNFYSQQNSSAERSNKLNASSSSLSSSHKIILRDLYLSMPTSYEKNNIIGKNGNGVEKDNIDIQRFLALTQQNENQTRSILHFI
eukprot:CAMPEP_0178966578 /NCGR_PEP_ID=MMETSP0789-20121207/17004_1 /TAXON_ID=3005 /ORGANISM="Rhizosolenia setigera, Strain CCMP 1694" /LENGTH=783 /DNA_ID=CAMNT_0020651867 /DNA_START=165 /DNA_END=2516 /DNA_ORIENTATION=+